MTSIYNNYNSFNTRMNMSLNKLNKNKNKNIFMILFLVITLVLIYFLIKFLGFTGKPSLYEWILGIENKVVEFEEEEEINNMKQVFNISQNIFTFNESKLLCKSFGAELATLEQVITAYKYGANWCNMGWSQDQLALYPIQQEYWEQIQKSKSMNPDSCGFPGVNGGYYKNPDLKFGVNCYGLKPTPKNNERINIDLINNYSNEEKTIFKFKQNKNKFTVLPFNKAKWSSFQ